ncbi:MAG: serine/threonine-protein kinase [Planctomycetia bacterium]|nr:serine/threonine-protein kinase [Planctomycetia bacterium]
MPTVTQIRDYFEFLKKSNLLSKEQLVATRNAARDFTEARGLSKWLIKRGWITPWQAQQLQNGHHRLFLGKYQLLDVIGQGGMGAVLKAEQSSVRRIVALKVMAKELLKDEKAVSRFLREIQSAASLNHPNIVAAIDADLIGDRYFLVMEYVEGRDLKAWLKKYGPLPVSWTCDVARQIALGLQHAHEHGMVHRDIKPSNIMVTVDSVSGHPVVKIMDFGLSRLVSETENDDSQRTRTGAIMGSPDYIAPEQASRAKDADIRADLFSLGCTMFQMLTGQLPFPGDNIMEKLMARATFVPPLVSSLRSEVPPELDEIVATLMRLDPAERIQTPADLADRLAVMENGKPPADPEVVSESTADSVDGIAINGPDDTLNLFLDQLSAQSSDSGSDAIPVYYPRAKSPKWIASAVAAACVIGLFVILAVMSIGGDNQRSSSKDNDDESSQSTRREPTKKSIKLNTKRK